MKECPRCKAMNYEKSNYCYKCGAKLEKVKSNNNPSHSKLKPFINWRVLIYIVVCIYFFLYAYFFYRYELDHHKYKENSVDEYINDKENESEENITNLSLLEDSFYYNSNEDRSYIGGKIKNNVTDNAGYISVTYSLYDVNGNIIGICNASTGSLGGGETWIFKALCNTTTNEIDHYKLTEFLG